MSAMVESCYAGHEFVPKGDPFSSLCLPRTQFIQRIDRARQVMPFELFEMGHGGPRRIDADDFGDPGLVILPVAGRLDNHHVGVVYIQA